MNLVNLVPLGELGEIVSGSTPDTSRREYWENGSIPWITPADLTGHDEAYFFGKLRKITAEGYKSCSTRMLPPGSILYSSRAPIGHCAVTTFPLCANQGFKNLIPNNRLDSLYGYYALKFLTPLIITLGRGATFLEISKEIFENVRIPLPPLEEQKRIAAKLQKADQVRRLRRYARELSDGYLQSVFLEMFGDPETNPKKWDIYTFDDVCTKIIDGTHNSPPEKNRGYPYITSKNIKVDGIDLTGMTYISEDDHKEIFRRCDPKIGDILYIKDGVNTGIAKVNILDFEFSLLSSVAVLRPDPKFISPFFFECFLNYPTVYKVISSKMQGGAIKRLTLEKIKELKTIVPPLESQERFSLHYQKYELFRKKQKETLRQAEQLFQALLRQAFE